jgi:hydrogenase/urease accessory protein HupE
LNLRFVWRLLFAICYFCAPAEAHEVRPAYLQLRETGTESYDVLWKVPGRGENLRLSLYVQLPEGCSNISQPRGHFADNAFVERWSVQCSQRLSGHRIHISGLAATLTDVLARLERLDGTTQVARLMPSEPSFVVEAAPSGMQVALTYLKLGVEHILTGIDHLLFVLALIIITRGGWKLVKTVTAFTVSHSITLTAATLGFVHVPQRPVEATIALSIVFVAAEIIHLHAGREGVTARAPWVVAFSFGLLHGFGFAGGLSEVGLPAGHIPTALLFFSAGVETGHLLFVAATLGLIALGRRAWGSVPRWVQLAPPYAIGSVAMFWVIERIAAF